MMRNQLISFFIGALVGIQPAYSETTITSYFGFPVTLSQDWFVVSPDLMAKYNENENPESLGIPNSVDRGTIDAIFEKVKTAQIEFYYDQRYVKSEFQNHISVQLTEPVNFTTIEKAKSWTTSECDSLPNQLFELYREAPEIHACQLVALNRVPFFRHSYTLLSQNITITNELIPLNNEYSIVIVGGAANDDEGLERVRSTQQAILNAMTSFIYAHSQ